MTGSPWKRYIRSGIGLARVVFSSLSMPFCCSSFFLGAGLLDTDLNRLEIHDGSSSAGF